MNSSEIRNQISIKLRKIYRPFYKKKELVNLSDEIVKSISRSNKIKNSKKSFNLSEKTSLLICYGDSVLGTKTNKSITNDNTCCYLSAHTFFHYTAYTGALLTILLFYNAYVSFCLP